MLLSQHLETRHSVQLATRGYFGYLLKDRVFDVDDFLDALRRVAGQRQPAAGEPGVVGGLPEQAGARSEGSRPGVRPSCSHRVTAGVSTLPALAARHEGGEGRSDQRPTFTTFLDLTALGRQEDWEKPKSRADAAHGAVPDFSS